MSLGMTVLDAIAGIEIGDDAIAGVTAHGLINLLVGIMSWSLILWSLCSGIDGNIAPGPPLDNLATMVMTPSITVKTMGLTTVCSRCRIRQS